MACCICQLNVRSVRNIFEERKVAKSGVIGEIIQELVKETHHTFDSHSKICRKCCDKVLRWHNSIQIAQQIQRELLQLLQDANPVPGGKHGDEKEAEQISKTEIKLESYSTDHEDSNSNDFTEHDDMIPSPPLNKYLDTKMITNNFEFVSEKGEIEISKQEDEGLRVSDDGVDLSQERSQIKKLKTKEKPKTGTDSVDIKCTECDQTFATRRAYRVHTNKEHSAGFICDQCGKTLQSYPGLTRHLLNHNPVKPLECPECGKGFHLQGHLKRHLAEHENSGESIHKCEICARRFYYLYDLQRHQVWHDDSTRRIPCEVCGTKFRTQPHLNRHMATHTGAKPHRCPICGKCFAQLYNMRVHHREHEQPGSSRQRRLKCKKCSRTFTNKDKYRVHCERSECEVKL